VGAEIVITIFILGPVRPKEVPIVRRVFPSDYARLAITLYFPGRNTYAQTFQRQLVFPQLFQFPR
jgi:hypothetical protein